MGVRVNVAEAVAMFVGRVVVFVAVAELVAVRVLVLAGNVTLACAVRVAVAELVAVRVCVLASRVTLAKIGGALGVAVADWATGVKVAEARGVAVAVILVGEAAEVLVAMGVTVAGFSNTSVGTDVGEANNKLIRLGAACGSVGRFSTPRSSFARVRAESSSAASSTMAASNASSWGALASSAL